MLTNSVPHSSVSQSTTTLPEASGTDATRLQNTDRKSDHRLANALGRMYKTLVKWMSRRKTEKKERLGVYALGEDPREQLQPAPQDTKFKTTFDMVIHTPHDSHGSGSRVRVAKVDTAADDNIISEVFVQELGFKIKTPFLGPEMAGIGARVTPMGTVKLTWHIASHWWNVYTTEFVVIPANLGIPDRLLLSETEIAKIGFYKVNDEVW